MKNLFYVTLWIYNHLQFKLEENQRFFLGIKIVIHLTLWDLIMLLTRVYCMELPDEKFGFLILFFIDKILRSLDCASSSLITSK